MKNIGSILSSGFSIGKDLSGGSDGSSSQRRAVYVDESGAFSLEDAKNVASVGSSLVGAFHDLFGG